MIFWVMDRWGQQKDCIGDAVEAAHRDELNGEDTLTLTLPENRLGKGDRVVWEDRWGAWHEHIVNERTITHQDGALYYQYRCENSIAETILDYIDEIVAEGVKAKAALTQILAGTRWQVGTVDDFGLADFYWFQDSVHGAIGSAIAKWGGEFSTTVAVSGEGVSSRKLNLESMRGRDEGKVFVYGHDMTAVQQTIASDDVVTRLHCFGKSTGNGDPEAGYTERLTFESINGGKDYIDDDDAKLLWGLPDGSGGVKHAEGTAIFEDCDDETELLELGEDELARRNHPHVSYAASVAALSDYGYDYEDARTGDTVWLRDKPLDLRLQGRVTAVTRYLVHTSATVIEMGDTVRSITDVIGQQLADLNWMRAHAETWNAAAASNEAWLNRFIANLNAQFDAEGGYVNIDPEKGITITNSATNPTMAMQLNGMGFRISNSKDSNGQWNWRTFGTGAGFAADEIVTGMLRCGTNSFDLVNGTVTLANGLIQDTQSANYWNLATGEMRLASTITVGGSTVQSIASSAASSAASAAQTNAQNYADGKDTALESSLKSYADSVSSGAQSASQQYAANQDAALLASLTQAEVLRRLTNDGAAQGIFMQNGQLYINGSYINTGTIDAGIIRAGILMDSQSNNYWNMATGFLSTTSGEIGGFTIGQSAIYNGLTSLTGTTEGVYIGTNGIACATDYEDDNDNTVSHSIAFSGGGIEGRYNGSPVGYIYPNATATGDDGNGNTVTLHGLSMRGNVIDLRTAHLTVKDSNSASGDSTHTITMTGDTVSANAGYGTRLIPSGYANNVLTARFQYHYPRFINGLYIGTNTRNYSGTGSNYLNFAMKEYVDAAISSLESSLQTWVGNQGYLKSVPSHTHSWSTDITGKPTIPTFSKSGSTLYITT